MRIHLISLVLFCFLMTPAFSTTYGYNHFLGYWTEVHGARKGSMKYLKAFGVPEEKARKYQKGPLTFQIISQIPGGFNVMGVQPDLSRYNATIFFERGPRMPYKFMGRDLEFNSKITKDSKFVFYAYEKGQSKPLFQTVRFIRSDGNMKYIHRKLTKPKARAFTIFRKIRRG